jgi:hypothetical protein
MIVELSRGHSESKMKSDRVGKAWREKKRGARDGTVMTERLPAWVRRDGDKLALIPERAAVVKRIFHLAASGYGIPSIIIKLREEKVPAWGGRERFLDDEGRPATTSDGRPRFRAREGERYGAGRWVRASVSNILTDRRATGEYQPRTRDDNGRLVADGPPVPNYYPAAVTQKEYHAAREGMRQRKTNPGRLGKREINVFSGLLHHAREKDETYIMTGRLSKSPGKPARRFQVLINRESDQGAGRAYSIPYLAFEDVVLSALREIDPAEVLGTRGEPDETLALAGELAAVESSIATIGREMDEHGESPTLFKRLREREARQRELAARLEAARQKAATPLSEAWGEAMSLAEALASAPDQKDARLRLRAALRRVVAGIWLLVVPREGQRRLFAVRVQFEGDRHRDYIALHVSASGRRPERWSRPFSSADVVALGRLDLRRPDHAARLEKALAAAELGDLAAKVDSRGGNLGAQ